MKRLVVSLAVVGATLASAAGMALAQATTDTFHQTVPVDQVLSGNPLESTCTGEDVRLTGEVHILTHVTEDANSGLHLKQHFELQGVSGTGLESGTRYRGVGSVQVETYIAPEEPRVVTEVIRFYFVSSGPSNNLQSRAKVRTTVNANGKPKVSFISISGRCVG